jgi:hypothetical protein
MVKVFVESKNNELNPDLIKSLLNKLSLALAAIVLPNVVPTG